MSLSLGSVIAEMLVSDKEYLSLSAQETEELIEEFVFKVSEPIQDYRSEQKISGEELSLISFR